MYSRYRVRCTIQGATVEGGGSSGAHLGYKGLGVHGGQMMGFV